MDRICKNCESPLLAENNYCNVCGARVIHNRLSFKILFAQFTEEFLNYDNKFFKTFIHLFSRPEEVILGYMKGVRKRYANPVSYFAIALSLTGLWMFIVNKSCFSNRPCWGRNPTL